MRGRKPVATRLPSLGRAKKPGEVPAGNRAVEASETEIIRIRSSTDRSDLLNEGLLNAIHEYLIKKNFVHTVEVFQKEMLRTSNDKPVRRNFDEMLVEAFDEGKRDVFFEAWKKYVPMGLRMSDEITIKLEFFIHIYFTIYMMHPVLNTNPIKPTSKMAKTEFEKFKAYLDRQGSELSKMPDLLAYFALTMVKDPLTNPTFSKIFTREWIVELRNQLMNFIDSMYSPHSEAFLSHMYKEYMGGKVVANPRRSDGQSDGEEMVAADASLTNSDFEKNKREYLKYVQELESNNKELVDIVQDYNNRYKELELYLVDNGHMKQNQEESVMIQRKWATFSKEILKLAKSIYTNIPPGIENQKKEEYGNKLAEFDKFLSINMDDLMMERQTPPARPRPAPQPQQNDHFSLRFAALDYGKIKGFLQSDSEQAEEVIQAILSSLKMRIVKGDQMARKQTIFAFTYVDLFDINSDKQKEASIYFKLLNANKPKIKEEAMKLFNLMCTNLNGRSYLTNNETFIDVLIEILKTEKGDSKVRRRSLGILQNLSLRKKPQLIMIKNGLVDTCFRILDKEKNSLCAYSLDYFTALLMNLCLRKEGREACENIDLNIFEVLDSLLQFESNQVRTFVNGILFSILTSPNLKQKIKDTHFLDKLRTLKERVPKRFQKQIDCIIEQAEKEGHDLHQSFEEENDDEYVGQDEDCFDDDISIDNDDLGEQFLQETFPATKEQEVSQVSFVKQMMAELKKPHEENISANSYKPLDRPTTPTMMLMEEAGQVVQLQQGNGRLASAKWPISDPHQNSSGFVGNNSGQINPYNEGGRLLSAARRENSVVYNNQSIVIDALPEEKKTKILSEIGNKEWQDGFISKPRINRTPFNDNFLRGDKL